MWGSDSTPRYRIPYLTLILDRAHHAAPALFATAAACYALRELDLEMIVPGLCTATCLLASFTLAAAPPPADPGFRSIDTGYTICKVRAAADHGTTYIVASSYEGRLLGVSLRRCISIQSGRGLKPEQYEFLADHFDLLTLTGGILRNASVEPNIAAAAKAIKQRNPKAEVLFYWASDMPKHQWKNSNATFPKGGYLHAKKGRKDRLQFDVRRQDVRDWWSGIAGEAVHKYGCDGIFVDGATAGTKGGPWSRMFGAEQAAAMDKGVFAMLKQARETMGPGKLMIFNPLHGHDETHPGLGAQYLAVTDGAMVDNFDRAANIRQQSPEYLANTIEVMRKAAKDGKIVIFKAWPGFTWWSDKKLMAKSHEQQYRVARERIIFPLASFLAGAESHCYFCYTWGWLGEYGTFDCYPEFDKPLGAPRGEAQCDGWKYTREFEHALVFVDVEKKIGKIDWKE